MISWLDKRICDIETESPNTDTYREWIHMASKMAFGEDVYDDVYLSKIEDEQQLWDIIDELDWILEK